jgi:hypothetical protein
LRWHGHRHHRVHAILHISRWSRRHDVVQPLQPPTEPGLLLLLARHHLLGLVFQFLMGGLLQHQRPDIKRRLVMLAHHGQEELLASQCLAKLHASNYGDRSQQDLLPASQLLCCRSCG